MSSRNQALREVATPMLQSSAEVEEKRLLELRSVLAR